MTSEGQKRPNAARRHDAKTMPSSKIHYTRARRAICDDHSIVAVSDCESSSPEFSIHMAVSVSIYLSIYLPSYHYCALCAIGGDLARTG